MPVKKTTVERDGVKMDIVIAMTDEEARDKSYMKDLEVGSKERGLEKLKAKTPREKSRLSKGDQAIAIKDVIAYKDRRKSEHPKKYF